MDPITIGLIVLAVVAFVAAGIIKAVKGEKVKKYLALADEAEKNGDDKDAIIQLKQALNSANEKPDTESSILSRLEAIYNKHDLKYDFTDFHKLTEQFKVLKKKSSNKAMRELNKVIDLKKQMVAKMPEL